MNHRKLIFGPCNYKEINDHETEGSQQLKNETKEFCEYAYKFLQVYIYF